MTDARDMAVTVAAYDVTIGTGEALSIARADATRWLDQTAKTARTE